MIALLYWFSAHDPRERSLLAPRTVLRHSVGSSIVDARSPARQFRIVTARRLTQG